MRPLRLLELAKIVEGLPRGIGEESFSGFALDSREAKPGDLFLAIHGARSDGHDFVPEALERGAVASLAEREVPGPHVVVPSLVEALARMAVHFRERFHGPVIGITGSVGKTTTKEFVATALSPLGKIVQTTGNRNTEYTAPLMWAEAQGDESAVVAEMGMRGYGQIRHLASFAKPTMGLITNIGQSHLEVVGTRQGIAEAKAELFESLPPDGRAFAFSGDDYLGYLRAQARCPVETFGFHSGDAYVSSYRPVSWTRAELVVSVHGRAVEVVLPLAGRHLAINAAAALLVASACGVALEDAALALEHVRVPEMRMQILERDGATLVLDAYNAAPASFLAALETLAELPCEGDRLVVMGEMRELGALTEIAHAEVGHAMARSKVRRACFLGEASESARAACLQEGLDESSFQMAQDLDGVRRFLGSVRPGDTVLIKGSRALELERALVGEGVGHDPARR